MSSSARKSRSDASDRYFSDLYIAADEPNGVALVANNGKPFNKFAKQARLDRRYSN